MAAKRSSSIVKQKVTMNCLLSVYSLGSNVQQTEGKAIKYLLGSVGFCEEVPEYQMDGVCGVAGSGPAYVSKCEAKSLKDSPNHG